MLFLVILCKDSILSRDLIDDKVDVDGVIEIGWTMLNEGFYADNPVFKIIEQDIGKILRAELDFTISFSEFIEGKFDIEGDFNKPGVKLKKGYVQFLFNSGNLLRIGNTKKAFGIEEMTGSDDLWTIRRSYLHRYFDSFHVLGYDFTFLYKWEKAFGHKGDLNLQMGLGSDGDVRIFNYFSGKYAIKGYTIYLSNLYVNHQLQKGMPNCNLVISSLEYSTNQYHSETELVIGKDPNASLLYSLKGIDHRVYFLGLRTCQTYGFALEWENIGMIEPVVGLVYVVPDLGDAKQGRLEIVPGVNILFRSKGKVRWMTDLEFLFAVNYPSHDFLTRQNYRISSQIQLAW